MAVGSIPIVCHVDAWAMCTDVQPKSVNLEINTSRSSSSQCGLGRLTSQTLGLAFDILIYDLIDFGGCKSVLSVY